MKAYTTPLDSIFLDNFNLSKKIHKQTKGAFNPALMPLVNYWGFGYSKKERTEIDSNEVAALKRFCNFDLFVLQNGRLRKAKDECQLDFSAVAKGYGVDMAAALLDERGIHNYMVEIGGEVVVRGKNSKGKDWTIAVDRPSGDGEKPFTAIISLNNQAIATSGNYRNYRKIGKEEYGHIIDPESGFPKQSDVLSASILAKDCASADAYATACMVMGAEKAIDYIELNKEIDGYVIYLDETGEEKTWASDAVKLVEIEN